MPRNKEASPVADAPAVIEETISEPKEEVKPPAPKAEVIASPRTVEQHALDAGIGPGTKGHWKFAAAKAMHRWPEGRELTAEEFSAAITAATTASIR